MTTADVSFVARNCVSRPPASAALAVTLACSSISVQPVSGVAVGTADALKKPNAAHAPLFTEPNAASVAVIVADAPETSLFVTVWTIAVAPLVPPVSTPSCSWIDHAQKFGVEACVIVTAPLPGEAVKPRHRIRFMPAAVSLVLMSFVHVMPPPETVGSAELAAETAIVKMSSRTSRFAVGDTLAVTDVAALEMSKFDVSEALVTATSVAPQPLHTQPYSGILRRMAETEQTEPIDPNLDPRQDPSCPPTRIVVAEDPTYETGTIE